MKNWTQEEANCNMSESKGQQRGPGIPVRFDEINANVVKVHVDGIGRTKENLVMSNLSALFNVKHFEDLVLASQEVRSKLQSKLNCYLSTRWGQNPHFIQKFTFLKSHFLQNSDF